MIRREVLKLGGVATASLMMPGIVSAASLRREPELVLIDDRFPEGRAFGAAAAQSGARVVAAGQDMLSLWHGPLRGASLGGLCGLTTYSDMVVIAGLAAEARRSFALRIEHRLGADGPVHRLADGPFGSLPILAAAAEQWPAGVWSIMAGDAAIRDGQRTADPLRSAARAGMLWSWSIA